MHQEQSNDIQWLTLSEAATLLSIHTATLRRWADEGKIPFMLTPGGHRRFADSDIKQLTARRQKVRRPGPVERIWANKAFENARTKISDHQDDKWLSPKDPDIRQSNRRISQKLMELILKFLAVEEESESFLTEARALGRQFGGNAKKADLTLSEVLEASMLFRETLLTSAMQLPENIHIPMESLKQMLARMNRILNSVQLGIAEIFEAK